VGVSPSGAGSVSPEGGEYESGMHITLTASPASSYRFVNWTGDVDTVANISATATIVTMNSHCSITANFAQGQLIRNWYDLDDIRDNVSGYHLLMNDLDSTTPGYQELASPTANEEKGWQPIGSFIGIFDGQGYEIRNMFIDRPEGSALEQSALALFGHLADEGIVKNIGIVEVAVTSGRWGMLCGSVVAHNDGTVSNSYATGTVTGENIVGGLVGWNDGTLSESYATCIVIGKNITGGLVGDNRGNVSNSCFIGNVTGISSIGGLAGWNTEGGIMSNSYATGSVTAAGLVGGLVGLNDHSIVTDSCSTGRVIGSTCVGGLVGENYGGTVTTSYSTGSVTGRNKVGGVVGNSREEGSVSNSFWDIQTSGQATSAGGTGKTTAEMKSVTTFSGAGWNIIGVGNSGETNPAYTWNIVDGQTCPFLSWQPVS